MKRQKPLKLLNRHLLLVLVLVITGVTAGVLAGMGGPAGVRKALFPTEAETLAAAEEQRRARLKKWRDEVAHTPIPDKPKAEIRLKSRFECLKGWDGSHTGLKQRLKKILHDPNSFEHVSTRAAGVDSTTGTFHVNMRYRAKNGFGALRLNTVIAEIRLSDCSVVGMSHSP